MIFKIEPADNPKKQVCMTIKFDGALEVLYGRHDLTWEQAEQLRDDLSAAIEEAKKEKA